MQQFCTIQELINFQGQKQNNNNHRQKLLLFEKPDVDQGLQTQEKPLENKLKKVPSYQIQKLLPQEEIESQHKMGLKQNYSFRRKLVPQGFQQLISPRVQSPYDQRDWIEFLSKQNEKLLEENEIKQKIINQLLESQTQPQKISNLNSPRLQQFPIQQPPKSVETKKVTSQISRLPQIKTPQPNLKHRIEVKETDQTQDESTKLFQCFSPHVMNQQNWSFGKQLNFDDEKIEEKQNQQQQIAPSNTNQLKSTFQNKFNQKQYSHPVIQIKTNFSKPLLKLPQEFHLQTWNTKQQFI
ncbi:unnamed protein product (macronuclear) [Paramecium tetraurelia]|uniref:Uncharacterized protein n=1 Tax=Paramecium tetraurelia TaxID=5888 RepID=A0BI93_PARTE|nr:uncharacterized protein GSPATT00004632001 [Paramecium tetraurelia]CAK58260.1 unnamed protein product [Paramecium tetraurelia]|eukprot:XP_001425658.1 hypothetical protein (macronuclear) [Paramecium tetraurelia strain d4-2]